MRVALPAAPWWRGSRRPACGVASGAMVVRLATLGHYGECFLWRLRLRCVQRPDCGTRAVEVATRWLRVAASWLRGGGSRQPVVTMVGGDLTVVGSWVPREILLGGG